MDLLGEHPHLPVNSLHLYRLQNVLMKVVRSGRPLIHLLKIWSVVSSYLVEVCSVSKFQSKYTISKFVTKNLGQANTMANCENMLK